MALAQVISHKRFFMSHSTVLISRQPRFAVRRQAFAVAEDEDFLSLLRYVERNPLRAGLVRRAEDWLLSRLACRLAGDDRAERRLQPEPVPLPANWLELVGQPQTDGELVPMRQSVALGCAYGSDRWGQTVVQRLGMQSTIRPNGRPWKRPPQARISG